MCLLLSGFIDFIVDPSFTVMTEMLEKILTPLQKAARSEEAISEEVFDKSDKSTSTNSLHREHSKESHKKPGNRLGYTLLSAPARSGSLCTIL